MVIGLGSMVGAGVFAVFGPASAAAGELLLPALALASAVAGVNAASSARLAARLPAAGGTYAYARHWLSPGWGFMAGWCFVAGKTASLGAMALTLGAYAAPGRARTVAVLAVVLATALACRGVVRTVQVTAVLVAVVLSALTLTAARLASAAPAEPTHPVLGGGVLGVLEAAGLLFFAFAGYARVATLGDQVRDPARTVPRAVALALGVTVGLYTVLAVELDRVLGSGGLARTGAPVRDAVLAVGGGPLVGALRVAAVLACGAVLLTLSAGVGRTVLAMARDRELPGALAVERAGVPVRAQLAVGGAALLLVVLTDLRGALGASGTGVLLYYAVTGACAWRLGGAGRVVGGLGVVACAVLAVVLALTQPGTGPLAAGAVLGAGLLARAAARRSR